MLFLRLFAVTAVAFVVWGCGEGPAQTTPPNPRTEGADGGSVDTKGQDGDKGADVQQLRWSELSESEPTWVTVQSEDGVVIVDDDGKPIVTVRPWDEGTRIGLTIGQPPEALPTTLQAIGTLDIVQEGDTSSAVNVDWILPDEDNYLEIVESLTFAAEPGDTEFARYVFDLGSLDTRAVPEGSFKATLARLVVDADCKNDPPPSTTTKFESDEQLEALRGSRGRS